ncbi:hypothetical protein JAAARDRAFT_151389 [Jaapia argillacea MUCL 33604]|uniref:BD-FAE-like domain-containing protein n=1 Tax=Jaapia argillacea MUCL 33604 TaxID=933084 RepID=A0A067Q0Y4_9AGAM|nr:hypothetical protein JAAARDRAFT_151389 [Jaapia argillacea MUCL 33604]
MDEFLDIPYIPSASRNQFHEFDLFVPRGRSEETQRISSFICFVHGGAWRSEDKADHRDLARRLAVATQFAVAVPNYRLTVKDPTDAFHLHHPAHAEDVLHFLEFLITWIGPFTSPLITGLPPPSLYLLGHSCSAHMLATIILDSSDITPSLTPSPALMGSVKAIGMSEGIYDIDLLLSSFPAYREWFIQDAFGKGVNYSEYSATRFPPRALDKIQWLVVHSKGDSLVDIAQSETIYQHLCRIYEEAVVSGDCSVTRNWDELDEEHNVLLRGDRYVQIIANFVLHVSSLQ